MITKSLSNVFGFIRPFIKRVQLVLLNSVHLMKIMRNMNIKANESLTLSILRLLSSKAQESKDF